MEAAQYLISLAPFDKLRPKLYQQGAFWTYYTGLECNQPLTWCKMEGAEYLSLAPFDELRHT